VALAASLGFKPAAAAPTHPVAAAARMRLSRSAALKTLRLGTTCTLSAAGSGRDHAAAAAQTAFPAGTAPAAAGPLGPSLRLVVGRCHSSSMIWLADTTGGRCHRCHRCHLGCLTRRCRHQCGTGCCCCCCSHGASAPTPPRSNHACTAGMVEAVTAPEVVLLSSLTTKPSEVRVAVTGAVKLLLKPAWKSGRLLRQVCMCVCLCAELHQGGGALDVCMCPTTKSPACLPHGRHVLVSICHPVCVPAMFGVQAFKSVARHVTDQAMAALPPAAAGCAAAAYLEGPGQQRLKALVDSAILWHSGRGGGGSQSRSGRH
jgi:hypothetical protein